MREFTADEIVDLYVKAGVYGCLFNHEGRHTDPRAMDPTAMVAVASGADANVFNREKVNARLMPLSYYRGIFFGFDESRPRPHVSYRHTEPGEDADRYLRGFETGRQVREQLTAKGLFL
jgi:hypothetical protein